MRFDPLPAFIAPPEAIKDHSMFRVRVTTFLLTVGHPLFYFIWTEVYPQPFESLSWRLVATIGSLLTLCLSFVRDAHDRDLEIAWVVSCCFGMTLLPAWFLVANGANAVWLASYCVMSILYFTLTDWRIAFLTCFMGLLLAAGIFPVIEPQLWELQFGSVLTGPVVIVVLFSLLIVAVAHVNDSNVQNTRRESQRQALGTAAHEVRTPLAGISILTDALSEAAGQLEEGKPVDEDLAETTRALVANLASAVRNAQQVVTTQLANSQPHNAFTHRVSVKVSTPIKEAIAEFELGDFSKRDSISSRISNDFVVQADPIVLKQVLINLFENAHTAVIRKVRHAYPGCIEVTAGSSDGTASIVVTDHGVGMSKYDLSRIFKPFYSRATHSGHGLGLAFVKSAVRAYGGHIYAESKFGTGSVFTITFETETDR